MCALNRMIAFGVTVFAAGGTCGGQELPREWRYDGRLLESGVPVEGEVSMTFRLFEAPSGGVAVGPELIAETVPVESGDFSVVLEVGEFAFDATRHWIELSVDGQVAPPRRRLAQTIDLAAARGAEIDDVEGAEASDPASEGEGAAAWGAARRSAVGAFGPWRASPLGGDPEEDGGDDEAPALTAEENDDGEGDPGDGGGGVWDTRGSEYYYKRANVGVGTSNPAYPLDVRNKSRSRTLNVDNSDGSGTRYGVYARAKSTNGRGVYGYASASSGSTIGVYGRSNSTDGTGVYGLAGASSGPAYGVYGRNDSTDGGGVFGHATATLGTAAGVYGQCDGVNAIGVKGTNTAGAGIGIYGMGQSGVYGEGTRTTGSSYGVEGIANRNGTGSRYGVHGSVSANGTTNYGVWGSAAGGGNNYGVYGTSSGDGVYGLSSGTGSSGVYGVNTSTGYGVRGTSNSIGVFAQANFGGVALYALNTTDSNNIIECYAPGIDMEFRVTSAGDVRCDGTYTSGGAEFAEWAPKEREADSFEPGEIVGLLDGRVRRVTSGAQQVAVISTSPAFIGNSGEAELDERLDHALIALMGRAPVRVRGPVASGDFIVASGLNDGIGVAVAPRSMAADRLNEVVGVAQETVPVEGVHRVEISVGVGRAAAIVIDRLRSEHDRQMAALQERMAVLEALLTGRAPVQLADEAR